MDNLIATFARIYHTVQIITACSCFSFSVLASGVLVYYLRRRYYLYAEMKGISSEKLWYSNYQNHLKNLKLMALISSFIIVILSVEIANNLANFILAVPIPLDTSTTFLLLIVQIRIVTQLAISLSSVSC